MCQVIRAINLSVRSFVISGLPHPPKEKYFLLGQQHPLRVKYFLTADLAILQRANQDDGPHTSRYASQDGLEC